MSNQTPEVEHLEPQELRKGRRKRGLAAVAALGVLAAAGAGAYGVAQFMGGGDAPATAVPGDALAYLSLDLDPAGSQKIEVLKTLRKFPALKEELGVDSQDDLRRWVFEAVTEDTCDDLDFDTEVDPWLGSRIAVSVVPGVDGPVPFGVVQVTDQDKATAGLASLAECAEEDAPGSAFVGDYMVVAESQSVADDIVADLEEGPLSDNGDFTRWVTEAGGAGVVTGYVAAQAPQTLFGVLAGQMSSLSGFGGGEGGGRLGGPDLDRVEGALEEFEGAAIVARFDDSALEVETAAGSLGAATGSAGGASGLGDLPGTTALAFGTGFADTAAQQVLDGLAGSMGQDEVARLIAEAEAVTGLSLPEDLQTLMGDGVAVAVDSSIDLGALFSGTAALPVGARIAGDPAEILPVLEKALAAAGATEQVTVESGDGVVALGLNPEHTSSLVEDGDLGEQDAFARALPELDGEDAGLYVDFDAQHWLIDLVEDDQAARTNLEPLNSLGISARGGDDGVVHGLVRLITD